MITKQEPECILCGKCLEVCPLFQATNKEQLSPRGKAFLLQELVRHREEFSEKTAHKLAAICLGCQKCVKVCPQGVNLPVLISEIKAKNSDWKSWLWGKLIAEMPRIFPLLSQSSKIIPEIRVRARGNKLSFFSRQQAVNPWLNLKAFDICGQEKKTVIFPGCTARYARKEWIDKATIFLKGSDYEVLQMPDWSCCAFTFKLAGLKSEQLKLQKENLKLWRRLKRPNIAVFCATCLLGLKDMAEADLGWEEGEKELWKESVKELGVMMGRPALTAISKNAPEKITLHRPCHAQEGLENWLKFLLSHSKVKYRFSTVCCGLGGSMQIESPRLSSQVAQYLWNREQNFKPQQLITACSGCVLQLSATHPEYVQVGHWLELLSITAENDVSFDQQGTGDDIEELAC